MNIPKNVLDAFGVEKVEERQQQPLYIHDVTLILQKVAQGLNDLGIKIKVCKSDGRLSSNYLTTISAIPIKIEDRSEYKTEKFKSPLYFELPEQPQISLPNQRLAFEDSREFYQTLAEEIKTLQKKEKEKAEWRKVCEELEKEAKAEILDLPLYEKVVNQYLEDFICNLKLLHIDYKLEVLESIKTPCYPASADVIRLTSSSLKKILILETLNHDGYEDYLEITAEGEDESLGSFQADPLNLRDDVSMRDLINSLIN